MSSNTHYCYLCGEELNDANQSKEHIILNAIGGFLKSKKLLCKSCNSKLGDSADAHLAKQFEFLSTYLGIKRDKGKIPAFKGMKTDSGEEYGLYNEGTELAMARPKYEVVKTEKGVQFQIAARSDEEMVQLLNGIKKKFPFFNVEDALKKAVRASKLLNEPLSVEQTIGGELAFQSLIKTAVNYYLHSDGDRQEVAHLFPMIKGEHQLDVVKPYYAEKIYKRSPNELIHLLHLKGDKHKKMLYCYIELFSIHSFIAILSTEYKGKNLNKTYSYDLIKSEIVEKKVALKISREELTSLPSQFKDHEIVVDRSRRYMRIVERERTAKYIMKIWGKWIDKIWKDKYGHEKRVTQTMIDELVDNFTNELVEYLAMLRNQNLNRK